MMVNVTFAVPEELHKTMRKHAEVKWSEIARRAMWEHARKLELMEKLVAKSRLTERQAEEIGEKIKAGLHKRHLGNQRVADDHRRASTRRDFG